MIYDVLIVGSGPAGAYLAYLLAKKNINVLIIDKEKFPREKVCGGGISQKTINLLDFSIDSIVQKYITGAFLTYKNRGIIEKKLEGRNGVSIIRSEFDNFILEKAIENGAEFIQNCAYNSTDNENDYLVVNTSNRTYKSKYLIGADGVFSKVRNDHFGKDLVSYAPAIEALVYVPPKIIDLYEDHTLFDFGGMPKGYGWIFPKKDHLNVGVYSIFGSKSIRDDLNKFMARYPSLKNFSDIKIVGFSIPTKNRKKIFGNNSVLLIGDSAGFAESFYGEGIYFALKSAVLASKALIVNFENNAYNNYKSLVQSELHDDLFYSTLNAKMFFPVQKFGYYGMVRNKYVNRFFAELIGGEVGHKECFYKTLFTSPYWLFSEKYPFIDKYKF